MSQVLNTTYLPKLALTTAQAVCKTCNGTLKIVNKTLSERARREVGSDYEYDYTDPNGPLDEKIWTHIHYGVAFVLSFVLIIIQLYTTLLGRRMRNEGLRWHVLFCCLVNLIQLFIYVDTAENSPWIDYLRNVYITKHIVAIEQITLSAFPASICCLVPIYIITYACPILRRTFVFKWLIWKVVYGGIILGSLFVGRCYYMSLDGTGTMPDRPLVGAWQFYTNVISWLMMILLLIVSLMGSLCVFGHATTNCLSLEQSKLEKKVDGATSMLMIWGYVAVCTVFHIPKNIMNMSSFFLTDALPWILSWVAWYQELMAKFKPITNSSSSSEITTTGVPEPDLTQTIMDLLLRYSECITAFLEFVPISVLMIPIVEFVAAGVFLKMYRESLLHLLSCGACYRSDKNGSIWDLIPYRFRSIYPLESLRWASPNMIAQGIVPPAPGMLPGVNGPMAFVHTRSTGANPILVETI